MHEDINKSKTKRRLFTGKFFRNTWLISFVVFVINIVFLISTSKPNKTLPEGEIVLFVFIAFASGVVGSLSFVFWILSIIDKRLSTRFEKYSLARGKPIKIIKISLITFTTLFVSLLIIYIFLFRPTEIVGNSMTTYKDGSIQLICLRCGDPNRGDVIIYHARDENHKDIIVDRIGRVVGLPGEQIIIEKGKTLVNGKVLQEQYADWSEWKSSEPIEISLGTDEYLAIVDKRINDSNNQDFIVMHKFKQLSFVGKILK